METSLAMATMGPMNTTHIETLEEYMARRAETRAELLADDGDNDPLVQYALGNHPKLEPITLDGIFEAGWSFKRQAI